MKRNKIFKTLSLTAGLLLFGGAMQSCEDFLTVYPTDRTTEEDFWKDKNDVSNVRTGAYSVLASKNVTQKILLWGEARSDNFTLNKLDNTSMLRLQSAVLMPTENIFDWSNFYTGINYCNLVLEKGQQMIDAGVDPSFTESDWRPIKAEMHALRSLYYFYLVRAFRNVPYVSEAITTDEQALRAAVPAAPGVAILGDLIDSLEYHQRFASDNYGNTDSNKGRISRKGLRALLADMYLWRGCMLKDYAAKGDSILNFTDVPVTSTNEETGATTTSYQTADGTPLTQAYADELSKKCFQRARELCAQIIGTQANAPAGTIMYDFKQRYQNDPSIADEVKSQKFPLIRYSTILSASYTSDEVFNEIFGDGNSLESVFEMQYDGVNISNNTTGDYLSTLSNGEASGNVFTVNPALVSVSAVNPERGFGKTDMRLASTARLQANSTTYIYAKSVARSISVSNVKDLAEGASYSYRTNYNSNWPVYRLSDVMLIWAEATARYYASSTSSNDDIRNAVEMVDLLFTRSNPGLSDDETNELYCNRVVDRTKTDKWYAKDYTSANLLPLVYHERQREFVGEGKFWFDIVRQAEFSNDPASAVSDYLRLSNTVGNRLKSLWSLYNPIYNEEMKVNTMLVQNPVWERYNKK